MSTVTQHAPGSPCWFELGTSDQPAADSFYGGLFGWTVKSVPISDGQYSIYQLGGRDVAAGYSLMPQMVAQGVPPHWLVYFSTPDVDATTAKVAEHGGSVKEQPFDVMTVGRMSVCADPEGAVFSLWQAKTHSGAAVVDEPGAVCWSELATRDMERARVFYSSVFGWNTKSSAGMPGYTEFSAGDRPRGGLLQMDEHWAGIPTHWGVYFQVNDCDASIEQAKTLGGSVKVAPFDVPNVGRIAVLTDGQGAIFSVIRLQM